MNLKHQPNPEPTVNPDPPKPARRFRLLPWWLALPIVLLGGAGGGLLYVTHPAPSDPIITQVRIVKNVSLNNPSAAVQDAMQIIKSLGSNPSLFLEIVLTGVDQPMKTAVREDTPIGNGLTFDLPEPVVLSRMREVRVRNDGFMSDKMLDRVDVTDRVESGQVFTFTLMGPRPVEPMPPLRLAGWVLVIAGSGVALLALLRFIALQVV